MTKGDEKQVEIRKPDQNVVVPATPQEQIQPPVPVKVANPTLVSRTSGVPTTCAQCGSPLRRKAGAKPFTGGPHQGGFLCQECWVLEWAEHPDVAADASTRQWFLDEAERIRVRRAGGSSTIYEDGVNRAYLTPRGTVLIDIARCPFGGPDEYDSDRFKALIRMFQALSVKVPGFAFPGDAPKAAEKTLPPETPE